MMMAESVAAQTVLTCWSCRGPVAAREFICATCGAVQPPGTMDAFDRLGFPHSFEIDRTALDRIYFDLQRRLHPDRFATRGPKERALSQQQAASLNEAYEILKEPLSRAVALLRHAGRTIAANEQATIADTALLTEMMEMREVLAEVDSAAEAERASKLAATELDACHRALAAAFAAGNLDAAERQITRLRYLVTRPARSR